MPAGEATASVRKRCSLSASARPAAPRYGVWSPGAAAVLALGQRALGGALLGDVDHLGDEVLRRAVGAGDGGDAQLGEDVAAVRAQVALLALDDPARVGHELVDERTIGVALVGMRDVGHRSAVEVLDAAADHVGEGGVDAHEAPVEARDRDADRRVLERAAKARLGVAEALGCLA